MSCLLNFKKRTSVIMIMQYLICLLYAFLVIGRSEAVVILPENVTVPAVIVFGDSIVDQGNNNNLKTLIKCNFPPYGKEFMGGIPSGRFSNGKTPADLIAEELGIKELLPAYLDPNLQTKDLLSGVSFASGGSGYDPETPQLVSVISLSDQLQMFQQYIVKLKASVGEEETNNILANSIVLVVVGSNDLANTYFTIGIRKMQYDIGSYTDLLIQSASNFLQDIYKLGARRIGVFGVPPVGCLPSQRTLAGGAMRVCVDKYNQAGLLFNTKLSSNIDFLQTSFAQAKVVYIDIFNPLLHLIQYPQNYGFEVVDRGCCGTGTVEVTELCNQLSKTCTDDSRYLFWDSYHPTEQGYKVLVGQLLEKYINKFF